MRAMIKRRSSRPKYFLGLPRPELTIKIHPHRWIASEHLNVVWLYWPQLRRTFDRWSSLRNISEFARRDQAVTNAIDKHLLRLTPIRRHHLRDHRIGVTQIKSVWRQRSGAGHALILRNESRHELAERFVAVRIGAKYS